MRPLATLLPAILCVALALAQDDDAPSAARALARGLDDAPYAERVERYGRIAALNATLPAPDARISQLLAESLVDDAFYVRERGLPLLLDRQDPGALVDGLLEGVERLSADVKDISKRLAFVGETAGSGDRGQPGFGEDDQRNIQASMLHARSLLRALAAVPDKRTEKALVSTLGEGFGKQPAFVYLCALKGCLELASPRSLDAVADFMTRLRKALDRDRIRPQIPRGGPWIGYGQLDVYGELREGHAAQALADVEAFHATLADAPRAAATKALRDGDWDAWLDALDLDARPAPTTLETPLRVEWTPHPDELLALMKPDWSWSRR